MTKTKSLVTAALILGTATTTLSVAKTSNTNANTTIRSFELKCGEGKCGADTTMHKKGDKKMKHGAKKTAAVAQ